MKNKNVGFLVIGLAVIVGVIIFLFNTAMTKIVDMSCSHGTSCPMYGTIKTQTYIGIILLAIIVVIGLVLIFTKGEKQIIIKKIKEKNINEENKIKEKEKNLKLMDQDEKKVYQSILDSQGTIFQSDLVEKLGFDKVKVTRILDRLEGRQLIERRRRGMTNVVILR